MTLARFALVLALLVAPQAASAQLPPIGVRLTPAAGWEELVPTPKGAAVVFRRLDSKGRVDASLNVVISDALRAGGAIDDPGVAEGLEQELLGVLPGGRVSDRAVVDVGKFRALRLTIEATVKGRRMVFRQTTIDVRRGAITVTASVDAASAPAALEQIDAMVASMAIDA